MGVCKNLLIIFLVSFLSTGTFPVILKAQKRNFSAVKTGTEPVIDGKPFEAVWEKCAKQSNFLQIDPYPAKAASQKTAFRILYNNTALFVAAYLYDTAPDSISTQLTERDNSGMADYFAINIDTYNDALLTYCFAVTAAGVQSDFKLNETGGTDSDWNAVWKSAVSIDSGGWYVEMKIPFSALRFPKKKEQTWGLNAYRDIIRHREASTWSFVDYEKGSYNLFHGEMRGLKNIEPPLRLSLSPYIAAYAEKHGKDDIRTFVRGGADLKYGFNENFTLDMMLIPDFGQVQSDDAQLNLSPDEIYYSERRQFFTEGTELFNRAGIFYSRRIGGEPRYRSSASDSLRENEHLLSNPRELQLLNAAKLTGKTEKGLNIGILNGITLPAKAEIEDSLSGESRTIETQALSNYNVSVLQQALKNNSFISLINTNFYIPTSGMTANVTGSEFRISDKNNDYSLTGNLSGSFRKTSNDNTSNGQAYQIGIRKISGTYRAGFTHSLYTDSYEINDLGYLSRNNYMRNFLTLNYRMFEPRGTLLAISVNVSAEQRYSYNPFTFTGFVLFADTWMKFRNMLSIGGDVSYRPVAGYDYYEPRVFGRFFTYHRDGRINAWISSDYSKPFALDLSGGARFYEKYEQYNRWINLSPRMRLSDRLMIILSLNIADKNTVGYIEHTGNDIYFGNRKQNIISSVADVSLGITEKQNISFRVRYYRSPVEYTQSYYLEQDGSLSESDFRADNINFNAFNIDMVYTWEFAPGSNLNISWKQAIYYSDEFPETRFSDNMENVFQSPQTNSLSLKVLYYLDYLYLKNKSFKL